MLCCYVIYVEYVVCYMLCCILYVRYAMYFMLWAPCLSCDSNNVNLPLGNDMLTYHGEQDVNLTWGNDMINYHG